MSKMCLLTCEHASSFIPQPFRALWTEEVVQSHRGWDRGALVYATALSKGLHSPLIAGSVSRLFVDLNRSLSHPTVRLCSRQLLQKYWHPFHNVTLSKIGEARSKKVPLYHFSCHSFTPVFDGKVRECDIGLLYDPSRPHEVLSAQEIMRVILRDTSLRVRRNYPYLGTSDGHTTMLRTQFSDAEYRGIELEVNQALVDTPYWKEVGIAALVRALTAGMEV